MVHTICAQLEEKDSVCAYCYESFGGDTLHCYHFIGDIKRFSVPSVYYRKVHICQLHQVYFYCKHVSRFPLNETLFYKKYLKS